MARSRRRPSRAWPKAGYATAGSTSRRAALLTGRNNHAVDTVEPAVTLAIEKVVGQAEGRHVQAFKGALTDVQEKMVEGGAQE